MRRASPPSPHQGVREEEGELVEKVEKEEKTSEGTTPSPSLLPTVRDKRGSWGGGEGVRF